MTRACRTDDPSFVLTGTAIYIHCCDSIIIVYSGCCPRIGVSMIFFCNNYGIIACVPSTLCNNRDTVIKACVSDTHG